MVPRPGRTFRSASAVAVPNAAAVTTCFDGNDDESGCSGNASRAGMVATWGRRRGTARLTRCPSGMATTAAVSARDAAFFLPDNASSPATGSHRTPPRALRLAAMMIG